MRVTLSIILVLFLILSILQIFTANSGVFKIEDKEGEWKSIQDTFIESSYDIGESYITLVADEYRLGGWFGSMSINLKTESGNNITGFIEAYIEELNIDITYYESYIPGTMGIGDKISNKLIIKVGNDIKIFKDYKESPHDSRLNTRIYFSIMNVNGSLMITVQDLYGDLGYEPVRVYYENNISYTGMPVNLHIKVYKNSGNEPGSIECSLFLNDVEDGKVYDNVYVKKIDYGLNDVFYLSLDFLIITIAFNLIANRIRKIKGEVGVPPKRKGK